MAKTKTTSSSVDPYDHTEDNMRMLGGTQHLEPTGISPRAGELSDIEKEIQKKPVFDCQITTNTVKTTNILLESDAEATDIMNSTVTIDRKLKKKSTGGLLQSGHLSSNSQIRKEGKSGMTKNTTKDL